MIKKILLSIVLLFSFVLSGCSLSVRQLESQNQELLDENENLLDYIDKNKNINDILEFYNKLSTEVINSFVLVESKNVLTSKTLYSNGIVVGSSGYYYYVITDNSAISQSGVRIEYQVMDSNALAHSASKANNYDVESGLILLQINTRDYPDSKLRVISLSDKTNLVAYTSSISQFNKIQLIEDMKTSTINYNDTSYDAYTLENVSFENGSGLINSNNELCGMYLSNYNMFVDSKLLREIINITYSLAL